MRLRFSVSKNMGLGSDTMHCAKNRERSGRADISNLMTDFSMVGDANEGK